MATRRASSSITAWRRHAIRRMLAGRRATLALVARLPEPEILRPRTQDQWSVKDVLGHLLSSDEETLRRFRLIARGQGDRIVWFESMAYADRFNARTVARTRRYGLAVLLRRMARAHAELVERLRRLPAGTLRDPSHKYTVVDWLPVPGWTHEQDHMGEVRSAPESLRPWSRGAVRPAGASPLSIGNRSVARVRCAAAFRRRSWWVRRTPSRRRAT
jgi:hypothetical protein